MAYCLLMGDDGTVRGANWVSFANAENDCNAVAQAYAGSGVAFGIPVALPSEVREAVAAGGGGSSGGGTDPGTGGGGGLGAAELSAADGALVGGAIVSTWLLAYAIRAVRRVLEES